MLPFRKPVRLISGWLSCFMVMFRVKLIMNVMKSKRFESEEVDYKRQSDSHSMPYVHLISPISHPINMTELIGQGRG